MNWRRLLMASKKIWADDTQKALKAWLTKHRGELETHGCDHLVTDLETLAGQDRGKDSQSA